MKTTNGMQILDVYDEIYRANERFKHPRPSEDQVVLICPNCRKRVNLLTGDRAGYMVECASCGFHLIF